jgi:magnesium transporter
LTDFNRILPILAFFVPMIISSGGNTGTQSAALIIRGLAVREMELENWRRVLWRELSMGLLLGLWLGVLAAFFSLGIERLEVVQRTLDRPAAEQVAAAGTTAVETGSPFKLPLLIMISITGVVVLGTFMGSMMPFFFKKIGLDPAVCSGPFVATLVDVSGLALFFIIFIWLYLSMA